MYTVDFGFDHSPDDPNDQDGSWRVYSFNSRHVHFQHPDEFNKKELKSKLKRGYAFMLSYYEHGLCRWSLSGEGSRDIWDSNQCAGVIVWEEDEDNISSDDRAQDARNHLEEYTDWCNGHVYTFRISDSKGETVDSCSGFYSSGKDEMLSEIHAYTAGHLVKVEGEAHYIGDDYDFTTPRDGDGVTEFKIGDCRVFCETLRKSDDDDGPRYRVSVCHEGYEFELERSASIKDHETLAFSTVNMLIEAHDHESDFIEKSTRNSLEQLERLSEIIRAAHTLGTALKGSKVTA